MANSCLPLSAGEDTFELEAMENQIHELLEKQAELREWRAVLESSRADAHKSGAQCTQDVIFPGLLYSGAGTPWTVGAAAVEDVSQALGEETEHGAVIVGDSIRATLAKDTRNPDDESVGAIVLHVGMNNIKLRQTEILKRDFRGLIETVRSTSPATRIIVSGPLPMGTVKTIDDLVRLGTQIEKDWTESKRRWSQEKGTEEEFFWRKKST
ncbi:Cytoplasmic protein NCK1 [Labeo rohita]|uniref:Cytoplasmic protein NCK1 n=1 Tax=Labeo rohita TaxID=84645 RepID=A0ABQ8MF19_LABRO|nr:Cytoplasmic protein NCK1 [Labeo rohita]